MKWHSTRTSKGNYVPYNYYPPTYDRDAIRVARPPVRAASDSGDTPSGNPTVSQVATDAAWVIILGSVLFIAIVAAVIMLIRWAIKNS